MKERMNCKEMVVVFAKIGSYCMLSMRRKDPWLGKMSGLGGGVEPQDCIPDICDPIQNAIRCSLREIEEEAWICSCQEHLELVAEIKIYRKGKRKFQLLRVFLMDLFWGMPTVTKEMGPHRTYHEDALPWDDMIAGDKLWVHRIFKGEKLRGFIVWNEDLSEVLDHEFHPCFDL